jgi:hypothetical protein
MPRGAIYLVQRTTRGWELCTGGPTINRYTTQDQAVAEGRMVAAQMAGLLVVEDSVGLDDLSDVERTSLR